MNWEQPTKEVIFCFQGFSELYLLFIYLRQQGWQYQGDQVKALTQEFCVFVGW